MLNDTLAKHIWEVADLLELDNDNPFRIRAFRRAAQTVETHGEDFGTMTRDQMLEIDGIGKGVVDLVEEFRKKGTSYERERLGKKYPKGLLQIMKLGGLGPKRAAVLYRELRIDSVEKLASAAKKGVLLSLEGFGEKLQTNILSNISQAQTAGARLLITEARAIADQIRAYLSRSPHVKQLELAGSARRWRETVGDLDFLCTSKNAEAAMTHFLKFPGAVKTLASGSTKGSFVLSSGLQVDFRVVPAESYGAALLYFSGSKEHNVRLRELAQRRNLTLNEYGLFKVSDTKKKRPVAGRTEEEVYAKLGLAWIPPELREDRGEIEAAMKRKLPKLVELKDVLGDFHNHTTLSDGNHTLEQMVEAAKKRGWKYFFSADHSPSLKIASGLPVDVLRKKMAQVKKLDKESKGIRVFTSTEVDILAEGQIDYPDAVLAELDSVVASVHTRFNQTPEQMTERLVRAVRHPHVDILGHISGRKMPNRPSYSFDYEAVFQAAKETQTAIEINGQPPRQELAFGHVKRAIELGVPLAVTTDAHSTQELDHMILSVQIARRGWAEARHIINCMPVDKLLEWLKN